MNVHFGRMFFNMVKIFHLYWFNKILIGQKKSIGGATMLGELWEEGKTEKLSAARHRGSKMRIPH